MALERFTQITESGIKTGITLTGTNVIGVITATTLSVSQGFNVTGVVTATGFDRVNATALNVSGVSTFGSNIFLGDGDIAYFGDGQDLLIFHNSTDSIIRDDGTGDLFLQGGNRIRLTNPTGIETYAVFNQDGASELYYDNVKRFETTDGGVSVSGIATATGGFSGNLSGNINSTGVSTFSGGIRGNITGNLTGNVNSTGISTLNNVVVGGAATALVVNGNARITGILTVGTGSITFNGTSNVISGVSSITDDVGGYLTIPPGAIQFFARNTAPTGWLKANGANISRSAYAILFNAVGTTFGSGDGSTTFTLPDMRGEFPRGWDDGRGIDSGRGFGTAQSHLFKSHQHPSMRTSGGTPVGVTFYSPHPGGGAVNLANTDQNNRNPYGDTASWNTGTPGTIGGTGVFSADSDTGSETRPRNIALLACIKY